MRINWRSDSAGELVRTLAAAIFLALPAALLQPSRLMAANYAAVDLYTLQPPPNFADANPSTYLSPGWHPVIGGISAGYGRNLTNPYISDALLWSETSAAVDLNPAGYAGSVALGVADSEEVGGGEINGDEHALLWSGSATSFLDLNPAGFTSSAALAVANGQQVGYGGGTSTGENNHALFWSGTAVSAVDLNPTDLIGIISSEAFGLGDGQEVGYGIGPGIGNYDHALVWQGSADSAVDLNPTGYSSSSAYAAENGWQAGAAYSLADHNREHAMLWSGSAVSALDLNPKGFAMSVSTGLGDGEEAGYGTLEGASGPQALLWNGSADSVVELASFLPPGEFAQSWAYAVDGSGNVFGLATDSDGAFHAIEWTVVPEPGAAGLFSLVIFGSLARRYRERINEHGIRFGCSGPASTN